MAFADLTKQLAQQAILSATKEPAPPFVSVGSVILGQIGAMQKALKEDEELVVIFQSGSERIRVMEIFLPSPQVAVLTGLDGVGGLTRVISAVDALQLLCRIAKAVKPARVSLVTAKPKDSSA